MEPKDTISRQTITPEKLACAKLFRRQPTPAERVLWPRLRRNQLGGFHFRRQQLVAGFVAELYCHAAGLIVEVDGGVHDVQVGADRERERILTTAGYRVIRFRNEEVFGMIDSVLARIHEACSARIQEGL